MKIIYKLRCIHCGNKFECGGARGKFCSDTCHYWFYARANDPDKCWIWSGPKNSTGYGLIYHPQQYHASVLLAHRASWIFTFGGIPDGLGALHHCDNPPCTNPTHLFLGTQADNVADRDSKGRREPLKGEGHGMAKITDDDVRFIRKSVAMGVKKVRLEEMFGFSSGYITRIAIGKMWPHVR